MSLLNRPLLGIVAFFGISSIIGSGFCLWVFNENGSSSSLMIDDIKIDYSYEASVGHFATNFEKEAKPIKMVFTEGNSSLDLNEGIEFYKLNKHPVLNVDEYVKDDSINIIFHNDTTYKTELTSAGLKLQLGVEVNIVTETPEDSSIKPIPLSDFIKISDDTYHDGNFVDLTEKFQNNGESDHTNADSSLGIEPGSTFEEYIYIQCI